MTSSRPSARNDWPAQKMFAGLAVDQRRGRSGRGAPVAGSQSVAWMRPGRGRVEPQHLARRQQRRVDGDGRDREGRRPLPVARRRGRRARPPRPDAGPRRRGPADAPARPRIARRARAGERARRRGPARARAVSIARSRASDGPRARRCAVAWAWAPGAGAVARSAPANSRDRTRERAFESTGGRFLLRRGSPKERPHGPFLARAGPNRGRRRYSARRPAKALPSVTSSAYSRSAPTGRPRGQPRDRRRRARARAAPSAMCSAVASPVVVGFVASTTSRTVAGRSTRRVELGDLQVLGVDAVDRRQRAAEHVVAPAVLVRALDRDDVARLLDDADEPRVAALVLADPAARPVGEVEADLAEADPLLDLADRVGERVGVLGVDAQDVEREPLRGALADARAACRAR